MKYPSTNFRQTHRRFRQGLLAGVLLLPLVLADRGFALDPAKDLKQYNCRTWNRQNGLPATSINAIAQTRDGYLWFGTAAGLLRFDGTEFKLFDLHSVALVRNSYVTSLASARSGGLWVGLENSAFGFYDGQSFLFRGAKEPGLDVQSLLESRNGTLWLAAQQLAGHLNQSGELETNLPSTSFTNANPNVKCGYEDRQGRVWFGTLNQGVFYWQDGKITKLPAPELEATAVLCITEDLAGQIWIGSQNGLYCYDASLKRREIPPLPSAVRALLVDRHGVLWIGTSWIGLARYQNGRYDFFLKADGLDNEAVQTLGEDSEGSLWIGTGGGLDELSDVKFPIQPATEDPKITDANSVTAARNGGVWIASYGGVRGFDPRTRTYTYGPGLPDIYTKRVFEARNGDLYFIVGMTNLEVASGGKIVATYGAPDLVVGMAEDDQGVVVSVAGALYRAGTNYFRPYTFKGSERPQFHWIANLASGRDGVIWVASGNGIFRVKDGAWQSWSAAEGLADPAVQTICEDQDGVVWAGLMSGIARLKDNQIRLISRQDGLFDDNIYAIVPDDLGNLWVDSGRGISRVARRDMNAFADGKTNHVACTVFDGLDSVKFTDKTAQERVGCKTADGRIWFPGPRGVVMIDPAHVPANPAAPPVHIERVLADGREVARNANTAVPPGKGELQFHFNALSFSAPSKVQIRYRLEGYDKGWVDASDRRMAFYTNLRPGRYTFRVTAANADGVWNETGDALNIELRPHYYQTAWFRLLCGGLAFAALIGIYLQRVRHMKLKQQSLQKTRDLLEAEVLNRTGELSYERDLLRSLLDYSPDSIYFKDAQSHFLKTSKAQAKLFGVKSADELVGKTDFDFFTEEHARPAFADEQEILRTGRPLIGKVEKEVLKGGQETWALTSKMPLRNKDGKIIGTFGISKDITTIKKVEAELAYQRDLLGTLMNHSPDSIFFKDLQSRFVRLSRSEVNNLRRVSLSHRAPHPAGEEDSLPPHLANLEEFEKYVIGKSDADIYGRDRAGAFGHDEEEIMRTGQPMIGKIEQTICPDGSTIWFMTTKVPWRNKDGEIIGTFGTSREISDLKNTEARLEQVHKQLLETSRRAGMAEIATNVLHNVGNVLNSVNISASLVADSVKKSKVASLANVVALLREHEHDLGTFITSDSKGKQLPSYLSQLSDHLLADQKTTVKELDSLRGNIEHIKEIVAMQQSYAKVSGIKEIININELVEDSLRMNEGALSRHRVEVIREFENVPPINVEKHKILQILVNLVRNAKHACQDSERADRRLTMRTVNEAGRIKISVIENGIGISPENLTHIFNHGFTTRKDGHGFGLHSGALAAKEMGGSLTVHSDGPGQGATFTLELPCTTNENSNE